MSYLREFLAKAGITYETVNVGKDKVTISKDTSTLGKGAEQAERERQAYLKGVTINVNAGKLPFKRGK